MSITSIWFIIFILLAMVVYYIVPKRFQYLVLLAASIAFYLSYGIGYMPYILATTVITYAGARIFGNPEYKHRKAVMVVTLLLSLGLLCYTKYTNFLLGTLDKLAGGGKIEMIDLVVPLGVSFYTFMSVGYILDVYWKKYEAEKNFLRYATFIMYFPHIVQGPIDRYNKLAPQFFGGKKFDFQRMVSGGELILWGFFLKLVIANRLGMFVDTVFGDVTAHGGAVWLVTLALYSIQTYADFLGCMEIARGTSLLFGIDLERNFDHPYFAKTIPEFWRRWHMTMGAWFKDYLFLPVSNSSFVKKTSKKLGKKFGAKARKNFVSCFSVAVVWLSTGIWHGAGWKFIAWGCYHGCLTIGGTLFGDKIDKLTAWLKINTKTKSWELFQMNRTFLLCCFGRIFFRANSISEAFLIMKQMVTRLEIWKLVDGSLYELGLDRANFMVAILSIVVLWCVSMLQERGSVREMIAKQNLVFRYLILYIAIFAVLIFGIYGPGYVASSFIYEQF